MNKVTARLFQQKFSKYKHMKVEVHGRDGVIGVWVPCTLLPKDDKHFYNKREDFVLVDTANGTVITHEDYE